LFHELMSKMDSLVALKHFAAQQRFRPIMLTTATTTVGLILLWIGDDINVGTYGNWNYFGLLFATVLTLLFVPVMYKLFFKVSYKNTIIETNQFVPYLCQIGVKTSKNRHKHKKPNKN